MLPKEWNITVEKSRRRTLAISVREDGGILVKAPYGLGRGEIYAFLEDKRDWIEERMAKMEEIRREAAAEGLLSREELESLADMALRVIPQRTAYYAAMLGVTYGRITIRNQRSRWGSCSAQGNLNFNCLLMLAPREVTDYVVVHELCHRLEMNHSRRFWELVESILSDYRERRRWLRDNGEVLMRRMGRC